MKIIDVCKEYTCELDDGTKIIYRKLAPKIVSWIFLSNFDFRTNGKVQTVRQAHHEEGSDEAGFDIAEYQVNQTILDEVLNHENSIVGWSGVTGEDGNEIKFDPKYIDGMDVNTRNTLFECIVGHTMLLAGLEAESPSTSSGQADPPEKKRRKRKSLK